MFPKWSAPPNYPAFGNCGLIADRAIGKDRLAAVLIDVAENAVTDHLGARIETRVSSQSPHPIELETCERPAGNFAVTGLRAVRARDRFRGVGHLRSPSMVGELKEVPARGGGPQRGFSLGWCVRGWRRQRCSDRNERRRH